MFCDTAESCRFDLPSTVCDLICHYFVYHTHTHTRISPLFWYRSMRDLFAKDTKRANLLGYGGGTWSRLFCWRNNIAMSRASSLRAAEFVGALARSHTTDTNIQSERSDLPAKMTSHEVFFNLNQVDCHFGFTATLTKSEKRQFTMLLPVPGGQSRPTHRDWLRYIFDLLWLLLYILCVLYSLYFFLLFLSILVFISDVDLSLFVFLRTFKLGDKFFSR